MCKYSERCWRHAYSKYLLQVGGYTGGVAPKQIEMVMQGYASGAMLDHARSIFARNFPARQGGEYLNLCPHLCNLPLDGCEEFVQQDRRDQAKERQNERQKRDNHPLRVFIPRDVRRHVAQRDKYTCVYCLRHISQLKLVNVRSHIDHVVPLAKGGHPTDYNNLCYTCAACNQAKFDAIWERGCREGFYEC